MNSFDRTFSLFRGIFVIVFIAIIGLILFKGYLVVSAKKSNKTIYDIQVNNFQTVENYLTTEYTKDEKTGCISFKDEFGIKHIVCNNYTISEY
jgi:LPS O-antigen subunit length determinant protein (WzzB/FepE family)